MPEQNDKELYAIFQADKLNRFYVPAVMMGHEEPAPPSARTVHILGYDNRSKYLSHSLHGVYDSIKTIKPNASTKYANVSGNQDKGKQRKWIEPNAGLDASRGLGSEGENGHISNLIVAAPASQTIPLLDQVKHRVDDRTAICYMSDGLGVAEHANNEIFTDEESRPSIVLGHMNQSFAKDRNRDAIRSMRPEYETVLTGVRPYYGRDHRDKGKNQPLTQPSENWLRTQSMFSQFAAASHLKARAVPLDSWMKVKIPSLMFASVADPICVLLDYRYEQLIYNPTANRLVDDLLNEIAEVVGRMYELRRASPELQAMLRGEGVRKRIISQLRAKKDAPSKMALQIQRGQLTDIDYLNGYFIRRGRRMGLKMTANEMVVGLVKAKHKAELEKLRSYIPLEMTSRR